MMKIKTNEDDIIAKEGYPFILGGLLSFPLFYKIGKKGLAFGCGLFGLFSLYFFRNPKRRVPQLEKSLISCADGKVVFVGNSFERYFLKKQVKRVSVFMSLFDVHVNRSPIDGTVVDIVYNKGKFISANKDKASYENEQCAIYLKTTDGRGVVVVQIAGLIARRIKTYPKIGEKIKKGDIIGLIRFGSRVDIYLEGDFEEMIGVGDRVKAGETVLGILK